MTKRSRGTVAIPATRVGSVAGGFLGSPLTPSDIESIAKAARVKVQSSCDYAIVAETINSGLHLFAGDLQAASTPAEHKAWFLQVSERLSAVLDSFGADSPPQLKLAMRQFLIRPVTCKKNGVEPYAIDSILAGIKSLRDAAAAAAAEFELAKKPKGGREIGSPRDVLASAMKEAWRALTGAERPTTTKPSDGGAPRGAFVDFTSAILAEAANRLAPRRRRHVAEAAAEIKRLASSPQSIASLARSAKSPR